MTAGTNWFAGDVDCDGNELATIRADELRRLRDEREKFMWQVRDTCARAEKAEALAAELRSALKEARGQVVGFMLECGHSPEAAVANVERLDAAIAKATGAA